jgi:uncharacterized protein with HEPN domain
MPKLPTAVPEAPDTPVLRGIMRKRAGEALRLLGNYGAVEVEHFQFDLALSYVVECGGRWAAAVPVDDRRAYPQLEWHRLVDHRPALLEDYHKLDMSEVVEKVRAEFPGLIAKLDANLGPEGPT